MANGLDNNIYISKSQQRKFIGIFVRRMVSAYGEEVVENEEVKVL